MKFPSWRSFFTTKTGASRAEAIAGPWTGTFDWQREVKRIEVPPRTREAIVMHRIVRRGGRNRL